MSNKKVRFKDLKLHTKNPFLGDLMAQLTPRAKEAKEKVDAAFVKGGEIFPTERGTGNFGYHWDDHGTFIKVFTIDDNFENMAHMSKTAGYLFWLICKRVKPNDTLIRILNKEFTDFAKTNSRSQFYDAVVELEQKEFIAKVSGDTFYLNPCKFFNGSRESQMGDYSAKEEFLKRKNW